MQSVILFSGITQEFHIHWHLIMFASALLCPFHHRRPIESTLKLFEYTESVFTHHFQYLKLECVTGCAHYPLICFFMWALELYVFLRQQLQVLHDWQILKSIVIYQKAEDLVNDKKIRKKSKVYEIAVIFCQKSFMLFNWCCRAEV